MKRYDVVIDQYGYPYGTPIVTGSGSLIALARKCDNLSETASNEYACRITEVEAASPQEAVDRVLRRARRANSR